MKREITGLTLVLVFGAALGSAAFSDDGYSEDGFGSRGADVLYLAQATAEPEANAEGSASSDVSEEEMSALMEAGQQHYQDYCAACHAPNGRGDVGPSLVSNTKLADPAFVYRQISVGGGEMPGFESVLDEEGRLAVGTFVRNSWGNEFGPLTKENVSAAGTGGATQ